MKKLVGVLRFVAAVVISLVSATIIIISIPFDPRGLFFHAVSRVWAHVTLFVCGVRLRVRGLEHIDRTTSYVYVSNHASMFDIPAIIAGIPDQIRVVYKKELEKIPLFGWGLKWGAYIGIDRGRTNESIRSLEEAIAKIQHGASVLLYAEGTRTQDGNLQPFKRGAFHIAVRAGVPVVPLTVNGSYGILPKHSFSINPGTVELILERPIYLGGKSGKETELQLMQQVHAAISTHYIDQ
ncbi:MAG: 1-acyl-sn-glycerol-3-phosphate acyltransferase [Ignavibacteriae bacterium]|nr:1-acyl-sn-glycerol-3-phosphate acyltransferase [Ignavibacteriota bacterium]